MIDDLLLMTQIGGRTAAFRAVDVQSVIELEQISHVPLAPPHIKGLTALRSQALTVVDCLKALGLSAKSEQADDTVAPQAIVVIVEGHSYALIVDDVRDVTACLTQPRSVPGNYGVGWARAATGMVETAQGPALLMGIEAIVAGTSANVDVDVEHVRG